MTRGAAGIVIAVSLLTACARQPDREYELQGQVLAVDLARQEVTIKHDDIPQFMPGMTMAFKVARSDLLTGRQRGDLVKATLVVRDTKPHLRTLERIGSAPVAETDDDARVLATLATGDPVADVAFIDQHGTPRRLQDWQGHVVAVTFMYARCPLPNFCPLMDRQFRTVQDSLRGDAALAADVRLLSVSFDPQHDSPDVLRKHAATLQADPAIWTFVTGSAVDLDIFASQFGVSILRNNGSAQEIAHNLRTAVIDAAGRLVTVLNGSEWTPAGLLTELEKARALRMPTSEGRPSAGRPR
jgi:protein SCO1/2